ncbi:type VII secretion protein EccE [Granulicoccus phenolivorans]|uniref:type VII secretion protein EccE n=1 Tax=Granulicoccus phenolivorans TaxID=266854 RepID=UPI0003FC509C|nr:type VII secretion protein EccE [Granulicoccus phenolivorans]
MTGSGGYTVQAPRRPWLLRQAPRLVALELAVLLALLLLLRGSFTGVIVGSALVLLLLLSALPLFAGRSAADQFRLWLAYHRRQPAEVSAFDVPVDLVPLAEWVPELAVTATTTGRGEEIGVAADGTGWIAVLALTGDDDLIADTGDELDLAALGALTRCDDIVFAGIQVVTYTVPAPTRVLLGPGSAAAAAYAEIVPRLPPAVRRTWLCVRLDPTLCLTAVTRRGAGQTGIEATLRFGLHRIQSHLKRAGVRTRALSAGELYDVLALTTGASPDGAAAERTDEFWEHWTCDGLVHTGLNVRGWGRDPSGAYADLLAAVTSAPVLFALTSFTLDAAAEASGAIRLVTPDEASARAAEDKVAALVGTEVLLGGAGGVQVPTLLATVPLGRGVDL